MLKTERINVQHIIFQHDKEEKKRKETEAKIQEIIYSHSNAYCFPDCHSPVDA